MKQTVKSIDKILPFGESIRGFLNQSFLTEADLKSFLRDRGVFLSDYSKPTSVPFITSTLISPNEFDSLKESQGSREDSPKRTNEIIQWESDRSLKEAVSENRAKLIESLVPKNCNYKLLSNPQIQFHSDNDNEVKIFIDIEREDLNKSWFESKSSFRAEMSLSLDVSTKQLRVTKTHTSDESKQVLSAFIRNMKSSFNEKGYVDKAKKVENIIFKDFDHKERFFFLFDLAKKLDDQYLKVEFKDISDIEFKPDPSVSLPEELRWMNDKSKVILKGKSIHNTDFLLKTENFQLLILWSVEAIYRFNLGGIEGTLALQIGFPDYSRGDNQESELIITPNKCYIFDRAYSTKKNEITKKLLDEIDKIKFDVYNKHKINLS